MAKLRQRDDRGERSFCIRDEIEAFHAPLFPLRMFFSGECIEFHRAAPEFGFISLKG
jgi:hypothetical protein